MTKENLVAAVTAVSMVGTLKFWNDAKQFGIVVTSAGDVHVHATKAGDWLEQMRAEGAAICLQVVTKYVDGAYKRTATAVTNVALPEVREVWASVKTFNEERCSATVYLGEVDLINQTAFIPKSVIQRSAIVPGVGMPMRATIRRTPQGWDVVSFESDEKVAAAYKVYMTEMIARAEAELAAAAQPELVPEAEKPAKKAKIRKPRQPKEAVAEGSLKQQLAAAAANHAGNPLADAFVAAVGPTMH